MFIRSFLLSFLLLLASGAAAPASEMDRAPLPGWVVAQPIPQPRPERLAQVAGGLYFLLWDQQLRQTGPGTTEDFSRVAYKVIERAGLEEAAVLNWDFDPAFERLVLHSIRILRGDAVIDLTDAVEFTMLRRETDLERGLLDGVLTAHANLPDVRVGDIVETALSRVREDRIAAGHLFAAFEPLFSAPLGRTHFRVIWPSGLPMTMRQLQDWTRPEVAEGPWGTVYSWTYDDLDPVPDEDGLPSWHRQWGGVWLGSMQGWGEVVDILLPHYDLAEATLPAEFAAEVDRIGAQAKDGPERIARALRLVEDRIRYVGIEIGLGGHIPRPPETVVARGFGDCKDKAVLLAAALRRLGIDAAPALTDLDEGRGLGAVAPSPYAFNHMIVEVRDNGRTWWLDPTLTHQGGLGDEVVMASYGYALPLRPGQADLAEMPARPRPEPTASVAEVFDFGRGEGSVALVVTTVSTDDSADEMRRSLAAQATADISRGYLAYYDSLYPGIRQTRPLAVTDDRDANRITVVETYAIPASAFREPGLLREFPMRSTLVDTLPKPGTADRRGPIAQSHPIHLKHAVEFRNPPVPLSPPDTYNYDGPYFQVTSRSYERDHEIGIEWTLRSKANQIPAADAAQYVRDVNRFESEMNLSYDLATGPEERNAAAGGSLIDLFLRPFGQFGRRQRPSP